MVVLRQTGSLETALRWKEGNAIQHSQTGVIKVIQHNCWYPSIKLFFSFMMFTIHPITDIAIQRRVRYSVHWCRYEHRMLFIQGVHSPSEQGIVGCACKRHTVPQDKMTKCYLGDFPIIEIEEFLVVLYGVTGWIFVAQLGNLSGIYVFVMCWHLCWSFCRSRDRLPKRQLTAANEFSLFHLESVLSLFAM